MGQDSAGITDKSYKMLGVTCARAAGMTLEEIAQHSRWHTTEMPLRYQHNSMAYKKSLAEKILI